MAPPHRLAATPISSGARRAQPSTARPPYSQQFVDRHPELCYAPRLLPVQLPEEMQPGWRPSPHTSYPSAHAPNAPTRAGDGVNGALHLTAGTHPHARSGLSTDYPHDYYLMAHPTFSIGAPPPYSATVPSTQPVYVAPASQSAPVPIPKPREPPSPPTPDATPPRPAVTSRRKPISAGYAQHGGSPTT
ncbi:hypothetical protein ACEPAI_7985 [Sanghuangporus weigelae]